MGDWLDIYTSESHNKSHEGTRLLSPSVDDRRYSYQHHHRSVSYGSFLPTFTVDVSGLKRLIREEERSRSVDKEGDEKEESNEPDEAARQAARTHHRIDSLFDGRGSRCSLSAPSEHSEEFLTSLERQLDSLFTFTSLHLSHIEEEMEKFEASLTHRDRIHSEVGKAGSMIQADKEEAEELDNVSIGGDSGIEDDHLNSAKGFLTRIKDVLFNMKQSIDHSMIELDALVGIHHQQTREDAAQKLLDSHKERRVELDTQIDGYISSIDKKLEQYTDEGRDNNERKKHETQTLLKATKEKFSFLSFLGLAILIASACGVVYLSLTQSTSRWIILLRLLRSPMMVVLYMFLLGFNMMAWARSGINYISIFDFPRTSSPTPKFMFRVGSMFSVLFALMIVVCLVTGAEILYISDKVLGFIMWIVIGIFWVNPFNVLNRLGRFSFLLVFVRVLASPLPEVLFADFWFADQLNSILAFLLDIQYLVCYSSRASSWDPNYLALKNCTMVSNGIRPILSCLPALWRLLQCLRCYQRTRKVAHLFNAVKYFTTFPVVIFATFFAVKVKPFSNLGDIDLNETGWVILAWLVSSLFHALYCFYWDIVMDWGLLRFRSGYLLRPTLLYSKWTYLVAIVLDFFIRFACVAKLTLAIVYHIDSDVIYTFLVLSEVLRRVLWNFFRIEYEQICQKWIAENDDRPFHTSSH